MVAQDIPKDRRPILLLAFANDGRAGRYLPSLGAEIGALRQVLSKAEDQGLCELMVRESTTRDELLEILSDARCRRRIALVHFAGHATAEHLLLEGEDTPVTAHTRGLVPLLSALENLELVFLNGCSTLSQARRLTESGIPAAISTRWPVSDRDARRFAVDFYRTLGEGSTVERAFDHALAAARCFSRGGAPEPQRDLTAEPGAEQRDPPWQLVVSGDGEHARGWSIPSAVHDPLFGIPAPEQRGFPQEPFRGLCRFTARDAGIFFGRGDLIRRLYEDVTNQALPHTLVVYGPSGAGKSSLLEAGLLPRLHTRFDVHLLRLERGRDPEQDLLDALDARRGASVAEAWFDRERDTGRPVVICVDQLESLIIGPQGDAALSRFVWALAPLLGGETHPRGKLILGLRKEWFPELRDVLQGHALRWQDHYVKPLGRRGIEEVILGPTRNGTLRARYGIEVEPGLARRIADDLLEDPHSAIAPTLQILLTRMWDEVSSEPVEPDGRVRHRFCSALYDRLRRDGLALGDFVERQMMTLGAAFPEAFAAGLVHDLLFHHTTSRGTSATHPLTDTLARYPEREQLVSELIDRCEALYLLQRVTDRAEPRTSMRLAHDTLAPIVRESYEKSQAPGQVAARVLDARMRTADDRRRPPPLDAFDLELIEGGQAGMRAWTKTERRLVERSRGRHARAAWMRGIQMFVVAGSVTFGLLRFGLPDRSDAVEHSARHVSPISTAKFETKDPMPSRVRHEHLSDDHGPLGPRETDQRPSSEEADTRPATPPESGAEPEPEPERAGPDRVRPRGATVSRAARCPLGDLPTGSSASVKSVAFSPDGTHVALRLNDNQRVFVFESTVAGPAPELLELRSPASRLAWSTDGRRLAVGEEAQNSRGYVELFTRGQEGAFAAPIRCEGHGAGVSVVVFSGDGDHLVTGDNGGLVVLRDGERCNEIERTELEGRAYDAAELPDVGWALGGSSAQVVIWRPRAADRFFEPKVPGKAAVHSVDVAASGHELLTTGHGVFIWDRTGRFELGRDSHDEVVQWAAWLGEGAAVIATTGTQVLMWEWTDGKLGSPRTLVELEDATIGMTADGNDVFIGDQQGRVHWWRLHGNDLKKHDEDHDPMPLLGGPIESLAAHPTGDYIVAGGTGGEARIMKLGQHGHPCQAL